MVCLQYQAACETAGIRAAAYNTFCRLWRELLPHIRVMKPMTDLCPTCQQNSTAIMRSANLPEEEKSEVCSVIAFTVHSVHLSVVSDGDTCSEAPGGSNQGTQLHEVPGGSGQGGHQSCVPPLTTLEMSTREVTIHYSFDFAQQVCSH